MEEVVLALPEDLAEMLVVHGPVAQWARCKFTQSRYDPRSQLNIHSPDAAADRDGVLQVQMPRWSQSICIYTDNGCFYFPQPQHNRRSRRCTTSTNTEMRSIDLHLHGWTPGRTTDTDVCRPKVRLRSLIDLPKAQFERRSGCKQAACMGSAQNTEQIIANQPHSLSKGRHEIADL